MERLRTEVATLIAEWPTWSICNSSQEGEETTASNKPNEDANEETNSIILQRDDGEEPQRIVVSLTEGASPGYILTPLGCPAPLAGKRYISKDGKQSLTDAIDDALEEWFDDPMTNDDAEVQNMFNDEITAAANRIESDLTPLTPYAYYDHGDRGVHRVVFSIPVLELWPDATDREQVGFATKQYSDAKIRVAIETSVDDYDGVMSLLTEGAAKLCKWKINEEPGLETVNRDGIGWLRHTHPLLAFHIRGFLGALSRGWGDRTFATLNPWLDVMSSFRSYVRSAWRHRCCFCGTEDERIEHAEEGEPKPRQQTTIPFCIATCRSAPGWCERCHFSKSVLLAEGTSETEIARLMTDRPEYYSLLVGLMRGTVEGVLKQGRQPHAPGYWSCRVSEDKKKEDCNGGDVNEWEDPKRSAQRLLQACDAYLWVGSRFQQELLNTDVSRRAEVLSQHFESVTATRFTGTLFPLQFLGELFCGVGMEYGLTHIQSQHPLVSRFFQRSRAPPLMFELHDFKISRTTEFTEKCAAFKKNHQDIGPAQPTRWLWAVLRADMALALLRGGPSRAMPRQAMGQAYGSGLYREDHCFWLPSDSRCCGCLRGIHGG